MAKQYLAKEVTAAMLESLAQRTSRLKEQNITPKLVIVRCGEDPSDLAYERGARKRASLAGVETQVIILPETADKQTLISTLEALNQDKSVHGVLLFRPLPAHLKKEQEEICNTLLPEKDVDCMTDLSYAGVFTGKKLGFAPCTAQAVLEILDHYGIDLTGKRVAVIGRSLVIGKPVSVMLISRHATVTVCHTKTKDIASITREADIIVSAAGAANSLTADHVRPGQTVIDVSVNFTEDGMCGDSVFADVEPIVDAITPVPGGVGGVTSAVLISHVVEAAER
ncbi:MAG: bifunctional 5,10-methylene-tetrahydrofolate dehydrogenase/5,10-methylene-tetrahydrofolate cyclohydrolase, partial [Clostridia bacterium]|nr:bifunctional 5,10-methylene-tetrahydrofolate dehydrogenase/5,10-methylene-tetrahydrofolate cyclohydrolase [Clostridia bacterium]